MRRGDYLVRSSRQILAGEKKKEKKKKKEEKRPIGGADVSSPAGRNKNRIPKSRDARDTCTRARFRAGPHSCLKMKINAKRCSGRVTTYHAIIGSSRTDRRRIQISQSLPMPGDPLSVGVLSFTRFSYRYHLNGHVPVHVVRRRRIASSNVITFLTLSRRHARHVTAR